MSSHRVVLAVLPFLVLLAACCGAATPRATTPSARATPQSLDEGLAARGLRRVTLATASREESFSLGDAPSASHGVLSMIETAGWNQQPSVFAERDGTVFLVVAQPRTIVDRHVAGGCRGFAGGRGWFERVAYTLPAGATYGGTITVPYDDHVEAMDYSDTLSDGTPCPPPAID